MENSEPNGENQALNNGIKSTLICFDIISEQIYCLGEKHAESKEELNRLQTDVTQIKLSLNCCATLLLKICDKLQISNNTDTGESSRLSEPLQVTALMKEQQQQTLSNQINSSEKPSNNTAVLKIGPANKLDDSTNSELDINRINLTPSTSNQAMQQMYVNNSNFGQCNKRKRTESVSTIISYSDCNDLVEIGLNQTKVSAAFLESIDWGSHLTATRCLLRHIFPHEVLATHLLVDSPLSSKKQLNRYITSDIIDYIATRCNVQQEDVRNAIRGKCYDEYRTMRKRIKREEKKKLRTLD